jgi:archaeal flagellar protein FlaI
MISVERLAKYNVTVDKVSAFVVVSRKAEEYMPIYEISFPKISEATEAVLDSIRGILIEKVKVKISEILDPNALDGIKKRFLEYAQVLISEQLPKLSENDRNTLSGYLVHEMLGLGKLEILLSDENLEEIAVNTSSEPVFVYHKKFGWLKTNIVIPSDEQIYNYASIIGRKVGRQITNLGPLMDAHLSTGDRVNATLFPISTKGNTITIRKFSRDPWTIIHLIDPSSRTLSPRIAALLWLCIQYELNIIVAGGTASGKTSMLNAMLPFIPPNHRIVSIEDTRELQLPDFLHWVPLNTREPNPEGKGEVSMLDLLVNSLRMRPDRVIVGEIRRQKEAEVLFEAMHTGHSVYATLHADRAEQVLLRLTNPPIGMPESMLEALHLVIVQFRHRKLGIRRTFQVAEFIPGEINGKVVMKVNVLYKWNPKKDVIEKENESSRLIDEIRMHTGMTEEEMEDDLKEKEKVLNWMLANNVKTVNTVGKVVAEYYHDKDFVMKVVNGKKSPAEILGPLAKELERKE